MLRVTEAQAKLLFGGERKRSTGKQAPRQPRIRRPKDQLPENIVKDQIIGFLEAYGWTVTRNHVGTFTPYRVLMQLCDALEQGKNMREELDRAKRNIVKVGKIGDPDWRAHKRTTGLNHILCFLEFKAPGRHPEPEQLLKLEQLRIMGTPAEWFDSYDVGRKPFIPWFRKTFDPALPLTMAEQAENDW